MNPQNHIAGCALLLPLALVLAPRKPSPVLTVLGLATLFSAWFGANALAVWQYAI